MSQHNTSYRFLTGLKARDILGAFIIPIVVSFVVVVLVWSFELSVDYTFLLSIIPIVSSIMIGFIATLLVASLSNSRVFEIMRQDKDSKDCSLYLQFVSGLYFNLYVLVVLLLLSIAFGLFGSHEECFSLIDNIILFSVLCIIGISFTVFMKNMKRLYQVIFYENR